MIAIIILLASGPGMDKPTVILGYVLLYGAAILTIWSMYQYLKIAWPDLSSGMTSQNQVTSFHHTRNPTHSRWIWGVHLRKHNVGAPSWRAPV